MYIRDTVAAIATPLGSGGVAIVRISGPDAERIGQDLFVCSNILKGGGFESHRLFYGRIVHPRTRRMIDEGMCVLMRAPRSYTREDVLELHCHGGYYLVRSVLDACIAAGARLATPGEFTRRAFLNGRIDLAQAESIVDLISSCTEQSLNLAQCQREGRLSKGLAALRHPLVESLALIEAHIDFPEDEVDPSVFAVVQRNVSSVLDTVAGLIATFATGKALREGVSVLLLGRPNAGKSSLLNALSGTDRAIVSELPGTTRDLIEDVVSLRGLPVKIIDAAGIRTHHADCVEREGVRRALDKAAEADLVLLLADCTTQSSDDLSGLISGLGSTPYLVVFTKSDLSLAVELCTYASSVGVCAVSVKTGVGMDQLVSLMYEFFIQSSVLSSDESVVISSVRHRDILVRVLHALQTFKANVHLGLPPELLSLDLKTALSALGEITGETTTDDLLELIFSSFCVGK